MLAVQGALACADESCIAEEVTLLQGVQAVRSHTNSALSPENYPELASLIQKGWVPFADELILLDAKHTIFDLTPGEDYTVVKNTRSRGKTFSSENSEEHASQIAASLHVSGRTRVPAAAFTASVHASTTASQSQSTLTVRHEEHTVARRYEVNLEVTSGRLVRKLTSEAENDFRRKDAAYIYDHYGAFRAESIHLGGSVVTSITRELRESESATVVKAALDAGVETFNAEAAASTKLKVSNTATSSAGSTKVSIHTDGGVESIWFQGRDYGSMQKEWAESIDDSNLVVIKVALVPLWELIGSLNRNKAKEFEEYCQKRWQDESDAIHNTEASRHIAAPAVLDTLEDGECLAPGDELVSSNGHVRLAMQVDGNLVVYNGREAKWSSGTHAPANAGAHVCLSSGDGNLVVMKGGHAIWASGARRGATRVKVQSDCNLVTYAGGRALWASIQDDDGDGC